MKCEINCKLFEEKYLTSIPSNSTINLTRYNEKQAKLKILSLIKDIEQLKEDLSKVSHNSSISVIQDVIESKEELLQVYKNYVGE